MVSDAVRQIVLQRDNYECQECFTAGTHANPLTMHHIVFKRHGGRATPENLIAWCRNCHREFHKEYDLVHKHQRRRKHKTRRGRRL